MALTCGPLENQKANAEAQVSSVWIFFFTIIIELICLLSSTECPQWRVALILFESARVITTTHIAAITHHQAEHTQARWKCLCMHTSKWTFLNDASKNVCLHYNDLGIWNRRNGSKFCGGNLWTKHKIQNRLDSNIWVAYQQVFSVFKSAVLPTSLMIERKKVVKNEIVLLDTYSNAGWDGGLYPSKLNLV